jgi:hypothetical protein
MRKLLLPLLAFLLTGLWSLACLASPTSQPTEAGLVTWLATNPAWSVVVFVAASTILTRALDLGLGQKLPKALLPWLSIVLGITGQMSVSLIAGAGWKEALIFGAVAGAAGAGTYSAVGKRVPGMKAGKRGK